MSENLEFIAIIAVLAVILFWYLQNIHAETQGTLGLFALQDDPETKKTEPHHSAYQIKARVAQHNNTPRTVGNISPTDNTAKMRRKFRRQDEVRYRVKDKK